MSHLPITLLTGFLGAGKTTLLRRYLADPQAPVTAVIINELGRIGIDQSLVARQHAGGAIVELTTGCLCCSAEGDVRAALADLAHRRDSFEIAQFTHLIIETTGLADPVPVLLTLEFDASVMRRYRTGAVVTVVDAVTGSAKLERHPENRRQVAMADVIVLSKSDLAVDPASRRDVERLRRELRDINPAAQLADAQDPGFHCVGALTGVRHSLAERSDEARAWIATESLIDQRPSRSARHPEGTSAFAFRWDAAWSEADTMARLGRLLATFGGRLLRVKGLVKTAEAPQRPLVVQAVGGIGYPTEWLGHWPDGDATSRLVVIAEGLTRAEIAAALELVPRLANRTVELRP